MGLHILLLFLSTVSLIEGSCMMHTYEIFENVKSVDVNILCFININKNLNFLVFEPDSYKEMILSNTQLSWFTVDGSFHKELPFMIPAGWTKFRLRIIKNHFILTLVTLTNYETIDVVDLELDFPLHTLHIEGVFSICVGILPEMKVRVDRETQLLLQPQHNQTLQVIGHGYIKSPHIQHINVTNTMLNIVAMYTYIQVFQENEKVLETNGSLIVGSYTDITHFQLNLFPNSDKCSDSTLIMAQWLLPTSTFFIGVVIGGFVFYILKIISSRKIVKVAELELEERLGM